MDDDELFTKWDGWLDDILADVRGLLVSQDIFWEVQKIIEANPCIHTPSLFYKWMAGIYGSSVTVGIRRQQDGDRDSVTLRRLLEEIQDNPQVLSRDRYVALYGEDARDFGHRDFDRIAGQGRSHIDPEMVINDLVQLERETQKVKGYVDRRIAHMDRRAPKGLPTLGEVDECLSLFKELLQKYLLIFRATTYEILPVRDYDWKQIFREPWIPS